MEQVRALWRGEPSGPLAVEGAAIVEWQHGAHTHLAIEVMDANGDWIALGCVALKDCRTPEVRPLLRQFPIFRLAWYGQLADPSDVPQR